MKQEISTPIIISLGGSILVPDSIASDIVTQIAQTVRTVYNETERPIIIVIGGGATARMYQDGLRVQHIQNSELLDWIGIYATRMNARFLSYVFDADASVLVETPDDIIGKKLAPITIVGGWKPGWSTDYVATWIAVHTGGSHVINISNIPYVYDKDPKKFSDAQPQQHMHWVDYLKLIPEKWVPGLSSPFDPVASRLAQEHSISVLIASHDMITRLPEYIVHGTYTGTILD